MNRVKEISSGLRLSLDTSLTETDSNSQTNVLLSWTESDQFCAFVGRQRLDLDNVDDEVTSASLLLQKNLVSGPIQLFKVDNPPQGSSCPNHRQPQQHAKISLYTFCESVGSVVEQAQKRLQYTLSRFGPGN
jgi:hypothetical protein